MNNYTNKEISDLIIDYIEYHKSKNDIPYNISITTLEHIFEEIKEEYKKLQD